MLKIQIEKLLVSHCHKFKTFPFPLCPYMIICLIKVSKPLAILAIWPVLWQRFLSQIVNRNGWRRMSWNKLVPQLFLVQDFPHSQRILCIFLPLNKLCFLSQSALTLKSRFSEKGCSEIRTPQDSHSWADCLNHHPTNTVTRKDDRCLSASSLFGFEVATLYLYKVS